MARDVITLRPVPVAESGAKVGDTGYAEIAFLQCRRYIALLRLAIGPEPDGARLRVRRSDIDFDPYIDVVSADVLGVAWRLPGPREARTLPR
jgi:hypothetical protein